jgi:hypothetical protein
MPGSPAVTGAVYTDVTSVPPGGYVTVYGISTGASSWTIAYQGNGRTVVQAPANATPGATSVTVNGTAIPLNIHSGRVITATTASLLSVINGLQPGDAVYLRAGTYNGKYDSEGWNEANVVLFKSGTAAQPIALLPYPGEVVTFQSTTTRPNFFLGNNGGNRRGNYVTIAGFNLIAPEECIFGGGNTADSSTPESGAAYVRVVGNSCTLTDTTSNTMTGMVALQGDGWKVIGNSFFNAPNRVIINNNHAIYVQNGADDVEIAYNVLRNLRMGHVIQVHQDGTPMLYTNVNIHDNILEAANPGDMRGITVSNVDSASTVTIANNTLRNLGQNFSGIAVYRGVVTVTGNKLYDINAPGILVQGQLSGTRRITATGNRFGVAPGQSYFAFESGAATSELVPNGNQYCGASPAFPASPPDSAPAACAP